ncbi:Glycine-rich RNA-binding protein [Dorcoceras hygrometricum]|uniref:Glycine-rich RNA-binding protein n=1 Tax=Dorcoceras hygrometricum TaxID=472368 RepID=A0A2Z7BN21_9LAMI|nr:Glycine-rich RNA-binding protein [Dorcoceras hygrometricum]
MAPSVPRTRAAAALRTKQISIDNQSRTIRRLRVQLATERRGLATIKKEHESTHYNTKVFQNETMKSGKKEIKKSVVHDKHIPSILFISLQLPIVNYLHSMKTSEPKAQQRPKIRSKQHLIIEALVEEKDSLLQTIQGLQEANGAPAHFDDEWEEEPEEEEIEEIPVGEGEIVDE